MKRYIHILCIILIIFLFTACANSETVAEQESEETNDSVVDVEKEEESLDEDELSINGAKVGMGFSELADRIPADAEVSLEEFNGDNYMFRFDGTQWTFFEDGILDLILVEEKGEGLDGLLSVGDGSDKIEDVLGPVSMENGVYIYEYPNFDIHIYTEEQEIESIRMILRDLKEQPDSKERTALLAFYDKVNDEEVKSEQVNQEVVVHEPNINEESAATPEEEPMNKEEKEREEEKETESVSEPQPSQAEYLTEITTLKQDANAALEFYLNLFSDTSDISLEEQSALLEEKQMEFDFWNRQSSLEKMESAINEKHRQYYELVQELVDSVDSMLTYKLSYLNGEIKNPTSYDHYTFDEMAKNELGNAVQKSEELFILENFEGDPLNIEG